MHCAQCRHWNEKENDNPGNRSTAKHDASFPDPETYEDVYPPFEVRYCRSPLLLFRENGGVPMTLPNQGLRIDGSGYKSELITGPQFGCVNFEAAD